MHYEILRGDCLAVLKTLPDSSFDSIVTDPPYELGFMGKAWDASGIAYNVDMWREALRVLKPGGHLLAFSGSRTYHRMTCAIEDAGFDIRDQIMWLYGSGFPKSLDVSKAIDKALGAQREIISEKPASGIGHNGTAFGGHAEGATQKFDAGPATDAARQWEGWGTALKPAHEPICVARKPLMGTVAANVLQFGTGALNIDGCRVPMSGETTVRSTGSGVRGRGDGWGMEGGVIGGSDAGRWPANLIHDGSDEVLAAFPETKSGKAGANPKPFSSKTEGWGNIGVNGHSHLYGDEGSAARFFYCAKASKSDRGPGNTHPTVKPLALMRYLLRLVTPPGGRALDPFAGSGSTIVAGLQEGFTMTGIELIDEHADIADYRAMHELTGGLV